VKPLPHSISNQQFYLPVIAYCINAKESFNGIDKIIEGKIAAPFRKLMGRNGYLFRTSRAGN
jgi:hypothetical protein